MSVALTTNAVKHSRMLAVIAAMEDETRALRKSGHEWLPFPTAGSRYPVSVASLRGVPTVLMTCRWGKVNAAAATAELLDRFPGIGCILHVGLAGGYHAGNPNMRVGDCFVASGGYQYDIQIPDAIVSMMREAAVDDREITPRVRVDPMIYTLLRAVTEVCGYNNWVGEAWTADRFMTLSTLPANVPTNAPVCFDMETAAVLQVAAQRRIPAGVVRVISDVVGLQADGTPVDGPKDFLKFVREDAGRTIANIVHKFSEQVFVRQLLGAEQLNYHP